MKLLQFWRPNEPEIATETDAEPIEDDVNVETVPEDESKATLEEL